jgi:hypothetical protein
LYQWLAKDPDVRDQAALSLPSSSNSPGEQGGAFEVINALVNGGIALGGLGILGRELLDT